MLYIKSQIIEPYKIFHAILGLWSLRIARTRENGSIQTPVDGWKFRVKCK